MVVVGKGAVWAGAARSRRAGRAIVSTAVAVVVSMVAVLLAPEADADDPPPGTTPIEIKTLVPGSPAFINVDPDTGQVVSLQGLPTDDVSQQCYQVNDSTYSCLGAPGAFRIDGEATTERFFPGSDAHAALGWIAAEGAGVVAALHDLPADDRVEHYARDEIRAYVQERLLDILDRAAYGLPLTADEQKALTFLQTEVLTSDRKLAQAAMDEYVRFKNEGCAYVPPAAPAFVTEPMAVPASVATGCKGSIGVASVFSPPTPSAEAFQTWGMYRIAEELGLDSLEHPEVQDNLKAMVRAGVLIGSMVAAGGAAAITTAAVGTNAALATAITEFVAANSTSLFAGGKFAIAFGSSAAGSIVGVVLVAVVAAALGIWQLVEDQQVGTTLSQRVAATFATTDPFGLAALQAANAGHDLDADRSTWDEEADLPPHRREKARDRLAEYVVRWSTVRTSGEVRPDPTGVWPDNATTSADHRFVVTDEEGVETLVDEIAVRTPDGSTATVRFDDGWLVVTPSGGEARAALAFEYVDANGDDVYATRQPATDGSDDQRFSLTRPGDDLEPVTTIEDSISYLTSGGTVETAEIVSPLDDVPTGARPTVTGPLLPGRTLYLRPNALDGDGKIDDTAFVDDFEVEWTVQRYLEATDEWETQPSVMPDEVGGNPNYGGRFVPSHAGRYRAQARLFHPLGLADDAFGTVEFVVATPDIELLMLDVVDDHLENELEVTVQASELIPDDEITVKVQWPGTVGSDEPGPVTETVAPCISGPPCGTDFITLTHPTEVLTDLRGDVTVTLANSHGASITRVVPITTPARPSFTDAPVEPGDDQPGRVSFEEHTVHVQLPAGVGGDPNYLVAGIVPGESEEIDPTFMITDPNDPGPPLVAVDVRGDGTFLISVDEHEGEPVVVLRGVPRAEDIGTYEAPIVIQQSNGARRSLVLLIDVVPATDDRFRAGLFSEVDPLDFVEEGPPAAEVRMLGGQSDWGAYDGEVCVGLTEGPFDAEHCGDVSEFFAGDGTPYPFPYFRLAPNGLEAGGGTVRIRAWLPDHERTFDEPMEVAFILTPGATPPEITSLTWDGEAGLATLEVEPSAPDVPIDEVRCLVDALPVDECFDASGGTWAPPLLAPGEHLLEVVAVDERGNYDSASVPFGVPDPGLPAAVPGFGEALESDGVVRVPLTLSHPVAHEVAVEWTTVHVGTLFEATPGEDYDAASGTVTFAPGQTEAEAEIVVHDDLDRENDQLIVVSFHHPTGAVMGGFWGLGYGGVVDDDWPKAVPGTVEVTEGATDVTVLVPVTLSQPSSEEVTVSWSTLHVGGLSLPEATPGEDYQVASGQLVYAPGETVAWIEITVSADALVEPSELLVVSLQAATNARVGGFWGLGFVVIHDASP